MDRVHPLDTRMRERELRGQMRLRGTLPREQIPVMHRVGMADLLITSVKRFEHREQVHARNRAS